VKLVPTCIVPKPGLENIFLFLAAKSKNKNFLFKSNIELPAYVHFRERMWISENICGFQRTYVDFREHMWISENVCGFQRTYVHFREHMCISESICGFQRTYVDFREHM
jgi:hypothetical protein